ncbi:MAG TPA: hypothetical protein VM913_02475 [Sphingomicrobium sp.]|nr:hypothetical protein [Sphingomicrobium sp.]
MTNPAGEPVGKPAEAALSDHAHPDIPAGEFAEEEDLDGHPLPEPGAAALMPSPHSEAEQRTAWEERADLVPPQPEAILAEARHEQNSPAAIGEGWTGQPEDRREEEQFPAYVPASEPQEPRRRGLVGLLLALLMIALAVAAFWFLAPTEWKQRLGITEPSGSPVMVQLDETNRRTLASGNELLEVTGKVINPTDQPQRVPQIEAMLRTYQQKIVYRWTIPPPAPVLAPGGSATFNSAELLSIPADAACLSVLASETDRTKLEPCTPASQQVAAQPS